MSSQRQESASCSCGQVIFDTSGRKAGEFLTCPWCQREYRHLGGGIIAPFAGAKEKEEQDNRNERQRQEGPAGEKVADDALSERMKAHTAMRKRQQALIETAKGGDGSDKPRDKGKARRSEIPGGALRMIAFIVVCNATALLLLHFLFRPHRDGTRETPWGGIIPRFSVPWPELVTLLIGHLCAFIAWACYVYSVHRAHGRQSRNPTDEPPRRQETPRKE